jgi:hypothetical protein
MSKFLEINSKTCVNVHKIEWIQKAEDGLSCIVRVGGVEYPSDVPYNSFVNLIQSSEAGHDNFHFAG